jgi:hypothetical protein
MFGLFAFTGHFPSLTAICAHEHLRIQIYKTALDVERFPIDEYIGHFSARRFNNIPESLP